MVRKKDKPKFTVRNWGLRKRVRVRNRWRRPRADSNKLKGKLAFAGASPRIGYKNAPEVRNLHPCGLPEVLVFSPQDLEGVSNCIARIGSAVGARKAAEIEKAAKAAGLKIANPRKVKKKKKPEKQKKEKKKELKPKEEVSKIASPAVKEEKKVEKKEETKAKPKEEKKPKEAKPPETSKPEPKTTKPETAHRKPKGDVS